MAAIGRRDAVEVIKRLKPFSLSTEANHESFNRRLGDAIVIGDNVTIQVVELKQEKVCLAVSLLAAFPCSGKKRLNCEWNVPGKPDRSKQSKENAPMMIPADETPLERVERELTEMKALPDIGRPCARPVGLLHLGPWSGLDEQSKDELLQSLDWRGIDAADFGRIQAREVKDYVLFQPRSPF